MITSIDGVLHGDMVVLGAIHEWIVFHDQASDDIIFDNRKTHERYMHPRKTVDGFAFLANSTIVSTCEESDKMMFEDNPLGRAMFASFMAFCYETSKVPSRGSLGYHRQVFNFLREYDGLLLYASPLGVLAIPDCYENCEHFEPAFEAYIISPDAMAEVRQDELGGMIMKAIDENEALQIVAVKKQDDDKEYADEADSGEL